jgi:hypothetical protein
MEEINKKKKIIFIAESALRTRREKVSRILDEQTGYMHAKNSKGVFFRYTNGNELPEYFILYKKDKHCPKDYPKLVDSSAGYSSLVKKLSKQ